MEGRDRRKAQPATAQGWILEEGRDRHNRTRLDRWTLEEADEIKCYYPPKDPPVSLPNLKTLELTTGAFTMNDLIPFLVTQLEEWKLDDVAEMKVLTRCLKLVEFVGFDGDERKVVVARSLLEHGNALEYMAFLWGKEAEHHEKSIKAMKEISNFHKASSTVKLRCLYGHQIRYTAKSGFHQNRYTANKLYYMILVLKSQPLNTKVIVMNKSKGARASEGEYKVDMISNLPDHILLLILSRIKSTEDVIRTRILSTRWRYLWTSVPFIDIDYTRGLYPLKEFDSKGFKDFVNWVLQNKPDDLNSFRIRCADYYNISTICQWIHATVIRKVKLLDLMLHRTKDSETIVLPYCLVTCGSLEVLRLCLPGYHLWMPNITGFQALRVLELNDVNLYHDSVQYLLENSPTLEDLSLIDCDAHELVISCPKLKYLRIDNRLEVKDVELLDDDLDVDWRYSRTLECFEFDPRADVKSPISLPNLKTLELILDVFIMDALIPFVICLPDLDSLHLIIPKDIRRADKWSLDETATMSILTRHLKKVEFLDFNGEQPKLYLSRLLLEHGNLLEEMVFSWVDEAKFHERSNETMNKMSNFKKASSTVKLTAVCDPTQARSLDRPQTKMVRAKWSRLLK
ncbi:hypothetical protein LXL04_026955 [Taraxacum kok-saghyz]